MNKKILIAIIAVVAVLVAVIVFMGGMIVGMQSNDGSTTTTTTTTTTGGGSTTTTNGQGQKDPTPQPSEGLEFELNDDGESYSVIGIGTCTDTEIVIPSKYQEKLVTKISKEAFSDCVSLTSLTLPNSIISIGVDAFENCELLKDVYYMGGIEDWLDIDFAGYRDYVDWSDSNPTSNGANLYFNGELVTSITIPNTVTNIGNGAFDGCISLTSITLPDSVISIGEGAFACPSLVSISIPNSVINVGEMAFACLSLQYNEYNNGLYLGNKDNPYVVLIEVKDTNISSFEIHNDTRIIYDYAFNDCTSLTSITIPNSVVSISRGAFDSCQSLTSITIPDSVTSIGARAFDCCTSLTSINIPDSVTSIGDSTFCGCSSLTSVTIPDSVTSIGASAFGYCESLTSVNFEGTVEQWNDLMMRISNNPWNWERVPATEATCSDGTVPLN